MHKPCPQTELEYTIHLPLSSCKLKTTQSSSITFYNQSSDLVLHPLPRDIDIVHDAYKNFAIFPAETNGRNIVKTPTLAMFEAAALRNSHNQDGNPNLDNECNTKLMYISDTTNPQLSRVYTTQASAQSIHLPDTYAMMLLNHHSSSSRCVYGFIQESL